jgi:YidC/Oxa1 family membrane protein insertase
MDRNSIIGLSLIFLILIGFYFINQPTVEELERRKSELDSMNRARAVLIADSLAALPHSDSLPLVTQDGINKLDDSSKQAVLKSFGPFATYLNTKEESFVLENEKIKVHIQSKGGQVTAVQLKDYKRAKRDGDSVKSDLMLFENKDNQFSYTFTTIDGKIVKTSDLYFEAIKEGDKKLTMRIKTPDGIEFNQVYELKDNDYVLHYNIETKGFSKLLNRSNNYLVLNWELDMPLQEKAVQSEREKSTAYYSYLNGDLDYIGERKFKEEKLSAALHWLSFKQQYFNTTLIADHEAGFEDATVGSFEVKDDNYVKKLNAEMYLTLGGEDVEKIPMRFFFGPNHFKTLNKMDLGMEKLVPLGWAIFGWVNRWLVIPVFDWLGKYIMSFGIIILLLTLIVKVLLFPLVYKSYISTAKMRLLKPEMEEIKVKYAKEPQKLQMENMKLFRKAGVSPMGGCLPMLLQMPVLIALFQFFPNSFELRQQAFLWADDLSTYDSIWNFGKIPVIDFIYGDHVSLFTLLMTISTLVYTRLNNELSAMGDQMKYISYLMPIMFLGFFNKYASGLTYYYFLSNVITFSQQLIMRRFVDEKKLHEKIQENKKKPVKKSKFQERLENMAKERGIDPKKMKK